MSDAAVRVALLGRAGKARDQLRRVLGDAGAAIVAEGDPAELDPATVAGLSPTCYLVSLEPAIERSLERFDDLLAAPGVEVMFDDAETSARLDGWDLNRWARHIAAKLLGRDGLPPAPEQAAPDERSAPQVAASEIDFEPALAVVGHGAGVGGDEGDDLSDSIAVGPARGEAQDAASLGLGNDLGDDLDLSDLDFDLSVPVLASDDASADDDDLSDSIDFSASGDDVVEGGELDLDVAELSAQLEAYETSGRRLPSANTLAGVTGGMAIESIDAVAVRDAPAAQAKPGFDFSNLALAPMEAGASPVAAADYVARSDGLALALDPMPGDTAQGRADERAAAQSHAAVHEPASAQPPASADATGAGAVVILAGLGGPDAVRQLLSSLPATLAVPVLLYQHLEVGKHERLVDQLAKISRLPVQLARDGDSPGRGKVSLLPAAMTATAQGDALVFHTGTLAQLIAALPPKDSMIVVLSGADPQLVPMILEMGEAGGSVLAQDPEVCFDAGAAEAMQRQGAAVYPALGLARQIAARWTP